MYSSSSSGSVGERFSESHTHAGEIMHRSTICAAVLFLQARHALPAMLCCPAGAHAKHVTAAQCTPPPLSPTSPPTHPHTLTCWSAAASC
jgi:hypothetical protein